MSETDSVEIDASAEIDTETSNEAVDSAPAPGDNPETKPKVVFDDVQQEAVNAIVGKVRKKTNDANQRAQQLEEENQRLKAQIPEQTRPVVPEMPSDSFSDTFEQDMQTWRQQNDAAIRHDERQRVEGETVQARQNEALRVQQNEQAAKTQTFDDNARKLGISDADLQGAMDELTAGGVTPLIADGLLSDPNGPAMLTYLARNPLEFDRLNSAGVLEAGTIFAEIREKSAVKPNISGAPDPVDGLKGAGTTEPLHPALEGVTYS